MYCAMCINEKNKKDALCFNINANNKCQIKKKQNHEIGVFFYGCYHPDECFFLKEFMFH